MDPRDVPAAGGGSARGRRRGARDHRRLPVRSRRQAVLERGAHRRAAPDRAVGSRPAGLGVVPLGVQPGGARDARGAPRSLPRCRTPCRAARPERPALGLPPASSLRRRCPPLLRTPDCRLGAAGSVRPGRGLAAGDDGRLRVHRSRPRVDLVARPRRARGVLDSQHRQRRPVPARRLRDRTPGADRGRPDVRESAARRTARRRAGSGRGADPVERAPAGRTPGRRSRAGPRPTPA